MLKAYKNLSPKTRAGVGIGLIAWSFAGLYLSDQAEEKFGYTPSEKDKEELWRRHCTFKARGWAHMSEQDKCEHIEIIPCSHPIGNNGPKIPSQPVIISSFYHINVLR